MPDTSHEIDLQSAEAQFKQAFGDKPTYAAGAPGRVNLIGEHTDYNDGFVLPIAIDRSTWLFACRRTDRQARIISAELGETATFEVSRSLKPGEPAWSNYLRGVVAGCLEQGIDPGGFDALIISTVPSGGGLSSSAALEVATATLVEQLTGHSLSAKTKAMLCQKAEHEFAGMPCGLMDQFVAVMAEAESALLIDCRQQTAEPVAMNDPGVSVVIINSNVKHTLVDGAYAERRRQCEAAARTLGVPALRDADREMLESAKAKMNDLTHRRARHVISENERTLSAARALKGGQWTRLGELMAQSHASLRDDFEVSCRELDALVELADAHRSSGDVLGGRMTGGGFGGCTVTLAKSDAAERIARQISEAYEARFGIEPEAFVTRPAGGAKGMTL